MTSKGASWRKNICHDVKQFVMTSKIRHDVTKFATTSKSSSWRQNVLHDTKTFWHKKNRHDVKKFVIMAKNVSWRQQVRHDVNNTSWRQKVRHDDKIPYDVKTFVILCQNFRHIMSKSSSLCQKVHHNVNHDITITSKSSTKCQKVRYDVNKCVMTWKIRHDVKKFVIMSKNASWRQKVSHDVKIRPGVK